MKKWLAVLLSSVMLLAPTGCTMEEKAYFDELEKLSQWEHSESTFKADLSFDMKNMPDQNNKMDIEVKGSSYSQSIKGEKARGFMNFSIKEKNGLVNVPEVKGFVDGTDVYISKNYIEDIMKSSGQEIPEAVKAVKQEYLLMDGKSPVYGNSVSGAPQSNEFFQQYMANMTEPTKRKEMFDKLEKAGSLLEFKTSLKKDGNTYIIEMDSDMILDQAEKVIENGVKNLAQIIEIFELKGAIPSDKETISSIQESYETSGRAMIKEGVPMLKKSLKGSKYTQKETFKEDYYHAKALLDLRFEGFGQGRMNLVSDMKKSSPKKVEFPAKENVISFNDYMELYIPPVKDTLVIDEKAGTIQSEKSGKTLSLKVEKGKDGETLYQFAPVMRMAGIEYGYDKVARSPYIMQKGEKVHQNLYEKKGVSYITNYEMMYLGIESKPEEGKLWLTIR